MANWTILKAAITNAIKTNGNKEITGQLLQNTLNSIVNAVGENATFAGIAEPATSPGIFDGPVFYLAYKPGTYVNFGGITVLDNELTILYNNSSNTWAKSSIGVVNPFEFVLDLAYGTINTSTKLPAYSPYVMYLKNTITYATVKSIKTNDTLVMNIKYFDKAGNYLYTSNFQTEVILKPSYIYIIEFVKTPVEEDIEISAEDVLNNIEVVYNASVEKITISDLRPFFIPNRYIINPFIEKAHYSQYNSCLSLKVKAGDTFSIKGVISAEDELKYSLWDESINVISTNTTLEPDSEITIKKDGYITFNGSNYVHSLQISGTFNFFDEWNSKQLIPVMQNELELLSKMYMVKKLEIDTYGIDIKNLSSWPDNMPLEFYNTDYRPINKKPIPSTYLHSIEVACSEGDQFIISGSTGYDGAKPYAFLDKNRMPLSICETTEIINTKVTAPENSAYLICQSATISKTRISKIEVKQKELKVLCFGNSFTQDSMSYVPFILKNLAPNVKLTLGIAYIGGCTLAQHLANFTGKNQTVDDKTYTPTTYIYYKSANSKAWTTLYSKTVDFLIADEDWDIITFQAEGAHYADWDTYWAPFIFKLHKSLFDKINHNIKIGWILTHGTYAASDAGFLQSWQNCMANSKKILDMTGTSVIFPYGTAVQNLRTTSLKFIGDGTAHNLTVDNGHLQDGIGCMVAAYANTITILKCLGLNKIGIIGEQTRVDSAFITNKKIPGAHLGTSGVVGVTDNNCYLAQVAAECAIKKPYEVTDLTDVESGI